MASADGAILLRPPGSAALLVVTVGYFPAVAPPGSDDPTRAAERILDAFASHRLIPPLSRDDPSLDEDSAYAIALEVYSRRVRLGEKPVGRKHAADALLPGGR